MTYEEMQKTMQFILEHQAKHEVEIQDLRFAMKEMKENQKVFEQNQKLLQEAQQTLIATVTNLALQAEADHQITKNAIKAMNKDMAQLKSTVLEMKEQADKDRAEMRSGMVEMRQQADKDRAEIRATVDRLSDNVDKLIDALLKANNPKI